MPYNRKETISGHSRIQAAHLRKKPGIEVSEHESHQVAVSARKAARRLRGRGGFPARRERRSGGLVPHLAAVLAEPRPAPVRAQLPHLPDGFLRLHVRRSDAAAQRLSADAGLAVGPRQKSQGLLHRPGRAHPAQLPAVHRHHAVRLRPAGEAVQLDGRDVEGSAHPPYLHPQLLL